MIKVREITAHEARRLVQDCFVQVIAEQENYGAFVPMTSQPEVEYHEQRVLSEDRITDLQAQVSGNHFDDDIRDRVRDLVIRHGYGPHELPDARLNDLANGVARVFVEQQRLFLLRLEDRLAPIVVTDDIFRNNNESSRLVEYGTKFKGPYHLAKHAYLVIHDLKARKGHRAQLFEKNAVGWLKAGFQ